MNAAARRLACFSQVRRGGNAGYIQPIGRWPANLIHDGSDEVLAGIPG
jgi:hypothetical protein